MAELSKDVIDTIIAEAVGDGVPGMTAVGWAIANRAAKGNTSPDAVVKKPRQFDGYSNPGKGVRAAQNDPRIRAQVKEIWSGIENRTIPDPLNGGTMFHASSMTPYWSDAENKHGTVRIGNQTYYKGGSALPPGELPVVGTLTDTVPPRPVAPVTPSIDLAQMRRTNMPSQLMPDTFASLPAPRASIPRAADLGLTEKTAATPYLKRNGDVLDPAGIVLGKEMVTQLPGTRKAVPQSTIERTALPRFSPDYISTSRQRVASTNPTLLPPIAPSTLGQGPSTRTVQSLPVRVAPVPAGVDERLAARTNPNLPQNQPQRVAASTPFVPEARYIEPRNAPAPQTGLAGRVALPPGVRPQIPSTTPAPVKTAFVPEARYIEPRNAAPRGGSSVMADYAYNTNTLPMNANAPERLTSTPMRGRLGAPPTVVFDQSYSPAEVTGTVSQTIRPTSPLAPLPHQTIARAPLPAPSYRAVGSELDTAIPPIPRPRPAFGMGGVDIPGAIAQTGQVAPTPMPRLQRPGLFGRPQLFGHDIPLPGIFGALQGATMAMNNASGPFNNGADNSLYNRLRGGDFNTPGAATRQSGGFLYAPKQGGGFINVGRANPAQSAAALYDSLNKRNDSRDDPGNRVNGSNTRGSGGARSLQD